MKLLVLAIGLFVAVNSLPFNDPEYAMVPDQFGWKLVNINQDPEPESFYNPETDIIFTLFTRGNREGHILRWDDPSTLTGSGFNPAHPTRVTIHGWNGSGTARVNTHVHESLFQVGEFNCITVDWAAGAGTVNYVAARNRVGATGEVTARLLRMIAEQTGADFEQMSAIGHSLGGHVAGFIGKNLNMNLNSKLGSIVALDAALPLFSIDNPAGRTHVSDALFVESHHTNAGLLGFDEPIGHSNFYPNWGRTQPGCGVDVTGNCAHSLAHQFYAESISSTVGFFAIRCSEGYESILKQECVSSGETFMGGEPLNTNAEGVYWLQTNAEAPFAQGRF